MNTSRKRWMRTLAAAVCAAVLFAHTTAVAGQAPAAARQRIGVAFGGGSARGLAHVGVVRWFEEHHVPIDLIAGTSMGGLIGGSYASGMSPDELRALLTGTDWDELFGFSSFRYKNIRRKDDARDFPSRIEFGLKNGLSLPLALNTGQQIDFMLARIAGRYGSLTSFDQLPTPFRAMAVDLVSARSVTLDRGSLATAMRATMSLPGVFPPIERDGLVLVDGGALNNVPADVVKAMGANVVIAVNVGFMGDTRTVNRSLTGLLGGTIDVMMQASTRAALASADIIINPPLEGYTSLDWRRSLELEEEGYRAAEALRDRLLPLAISDAQWAAYLEQRRARRKTEWPAPDRVSIVGATAADTEQIERLLQARLGKALDVDALETDLETLTGLDRYDTIGWQLEDAGGQTNLRIDARPKAHAPPFLMFGINLQNTTTDDFSFQLAARYLTFDPVGAGSELRIDAVMGVQPRLGAELYRPFGKTPVFMTVFAGARRDDVNFVADHRVAARYTQKRSLGGAGLGVNLSHVSDLRFGVSFGRLSATVDAGDPGLPELSGSEGRAQLAWRYDGHDSAVVPSAGLRSNFRLDHIFRSPDLPAGFPSGRSNDGITKAEVTASQFWSLGRRRRDRVFVAGGAGTASGDPLANEQFQVGAPFRLGALDSGELRGDHYAVVSLGYLRGVARLPDLIGGPLFLGGWVENGSAFDSWDTAPIHTNLSLGAIADTLVGPTLLGASFDLRGGWRYYVGIGRLF